MDVIDASHFEVIKQFINKTSYLFKLRHSKRTSIWTIELIAAHDYKYFQSVSLGEALKLASDWIRDNAVQKRETEAPSLGEASRNSTPVGKEVRG